MARYILLRIEDNTDAEKFVEALKAPGGVWFYEPNPDANSHTVSEGMEDVYRMRPLAPEQVQVRGLFAAPTKFCDCPDKSDTSARSANFGWWVHLKCKKPKKGNMQHPYNLLGRNELGKHKPELYIGVTEPWTKEDK
jgi:hypothetical protein